MCGKRCFANTCIMGKVKFSFLFWCCTFEKPVLIYSCTANYCYTGPVLDRSTVKRRTRGKKINVFSPWVSAMKRAEISRVVSQVSLHFRYSLLECSADTAEFRCWYRLRSRKVSHALPFFFFGDGARIYNSRMLKFFNSQNQRLCSKVVKQLKF